MKSIFITINYLDFANARVSINSNGLTKKEKKETKKDENNERQTTQNVKVKTHKGLEST